MYSRYRGLKQLPHGWRPAAAPVARGAACAFAIARATRTQGLGGKIIPHGSQGSTSQLQRVWTSMETREEGAASAARRIGAALGQLGAEATFAVLTGAGISVAAGIPALAAARKREAVTVKLEAAGPTDVHRMVAALVRQARDTGRPEPVLLTTNHDDIEVAMSELRGTIRLHGGLAHRRCPSCEAVWLATTPDSQHPACGGRTRRGVFEGECAMRKGRGAQTGKSEDWREYREAYEALRDEARRVRLLIVIGLDGSVSTSALRKLVEITVEENGGRALFVDLSPKPTTLWHALHNGPQSLGAHHGERLERITADAQDVASALGQGASPDVAAWCPDHASASDAMHAGERRDAILAASGRALAEVKAMLPEEHTLRQALYGFAKGDSTGRKRQKAARQRSSNETGVPSSSSASSDH